jgi:Peptidase S24-like
MDDIRNTLDQLIREHGADYISVSKLLGRNAAYIQQFIKRGVPRKLDEDDRRTLASYFGVAEKILGAPESPIFAPDPMKRVPRFALGASAGPGAVGDDEPELGQFGFDAKWLRDLTANPESLSGIRVAGDSMEPTLTDGDEILVDGSDTTNRIRDGIYVLRVDDVLIVKRLAISPVDRRYTIRSDNPTYPDWEGVDPATVTVIGRVLWAGRKVR